MSELHRAGFTALLLFLLLLASASEARAMKISMTIGLDSTLQLDGGAVDPLSGTLEVECPTASCVESGDVVWDVTELGLQSASISLSDSGPATFISHPSAAVGFLVLRVLTLHDSGLLTIPPEKPATLSYGFEPVLTGTTGTVQHYRYWSLRTVGPTNDWVGAFTPERVVLDLLLEEVFLDLDVLGITGTSIGQTAAIHLVAVPVAVPEPGLALLLLAALAAGRARYPAIVP